MKFMKPQMQRYINFYFQVHQPRRLKPFQFFDIGMSKSYFDDSRNEEILVRVARECYLPANTMLLKLIKKHPEVRITFSLSGIVIEQLKMFAPEALESFRELASTGAVEFLCETYYHSLASLLSKSEFVNEVEKHRMTIIENLQYEPKVFRNTELIYSNVIGKIVSDLGFKGIYFDGIERVLQGRSTNGIYSHPENKIALVPRNYSLSDDIAFRYSDVNWSEWPLTSDKLLNWIQHIPAEDNFVSLGMDYETLGEHHKTSDGILNFMESFLGRIARDTQLTYANPSEIIGKIKTAETLSVEKLISWADQERDVSAWLGNDMQRDAFEFMKRLLPDIRKTGNKKLLSDFRYLLTSDHFYYMSTKRGSDGEVHRYFSPYRSPYEAFMNYMNIVSDLEYRLKAVLRDPKPKIVYLSKDLRSNHFHSN